MSGNRRFSFRNYTAIVELSSVASEAIGAMQAGWEHIEGVEITEEYLPIARARVEYWRGRNQAELIK